MSTSIPRSGPRRVQIWAAIVAVGLFFTAFIGHAQGQAKSVALQGPLGGSAPRAVGPGGATQEVVVSAPSHASKSGTLTAYQYSGGSWHVAYGPVAAELGYNGLSDNRTEGDGTTPTGTYGFGATMYGLGPSLNSRYAYHTLGCGDWWSGEHDATYNQFVHLPCGQNLSNSLSEALWKQTTAYQHFAVINFNMNPTIQGRGSAIFLHDDTTSGVTAGCIAIAPNALESVLGWLDPAQNPVIRIGTTGEVGPPAPLSAGPYPAATAFRSDGVLASAPATVTLPDLGAAAFVHGTDDNIWWSTRTKGWASLGQPPGGLAGDPAVVSWGPGRIDLFVQGLDNKLWQRWSGCSGCQWSPWLQPVGADGVLASPPAVTSWTPGRIDVIVQGTDANFYQRDWDTSAWSGAWQQIGSPPVGPRPAEHATVTTWAPGRLDVFVRGRDDKLWQTFLTDGVWPGWFQPPGTADGTLNAAPTANAWNGGPSDGRNRLTVFVQGTDNHLYQTTYDGGWSAWNREGAPGDVFRGPPQAPSTLRSQPYVLVQGTDSMCYAFFPPG